MAEMEEETSAARLAYIRHAVTDDGGGYQLLNRSDARWLLARLDRYRLLLDVAMSPEWRAEEDA